MQKSYPRWVEFLYGPFFKVIGFFYRAYTANRARVEKLKTGRKFSMFLRALAVAVLLGWILIWALAPDEAGKRLTDEVRQSLDGFIPRADD